MASATRDDPPVRTTMPSAWRSSFTSWVGTAHTNHQKPPATASAAATHRATTADLIRRVQDTPRTPHGAPSWSGGCGRGEGADIAATSRNTSYHGAWSGV